MSNSSAATTAVAPQMPAAVPLARDEHGRALSVPPEAAFWRVRRHTGGRPRNVAGPDRQPMKLPLDFTDADLDAMLGSGTYRLDLCDAEGNPLDVTATVALGEAEPLATTDPAVEPSALLPSSASDVRLVLEANIRATQLSFAHHERTLAASLRMADTLRDGIRDLASAQANWITAISSARGFFRNGAPALPAPVVDAAKKPDEDEYDEGDESVADAGPWAAIGTMLVPVVATATEAAVKAFLNRSAKSTGLTASTGKGFELADVLDWRRAAKKSEAKAGALTDGAPSGEQVMQQLQTKAMEVFTRLDKAEQARLLALVPKLRVTDPEMQKLVAELLPLPPDDAAAWVRAHLDEIERRFAS